MSSATVMPCAKKLSRKPRLLPVSCRASLTELLVCPDHALALPLVRREHFTTLGLCEHRERDAGTVGVRVEGEASEGAGVAPHSFLEEFARTRELERLLGIHQAAGEGGHADIHPGQTLRADADEDLRSRLLVSPQDRDHPVHVREEFGSEHDRLGLGESRLLLEELEHRSEGLPGATSREVGGLARDERDPLEAVASLRAKTLSLCLASVPRS
jgi:hypothetical protein